METLQKEANKLREANGGVWGNMPNFPTEDWTDEVTNGDTRLGYWEWVAHQMDTKKVEKEQINLEFSDIARTCVQLHDKINALEDNIISFKETWD